MTHGRKQVVEYALLIVGVVLVVFLIFILTACAAGRNDAGDIIVGLKVGSLPETARQLANAAASFLPPPWNMVASIGVGLLGGGGVVGAAATKIKVAAEAARNEAEARTHAIYAQPPVNGSVAAVGQTIAAGFAEKPAPIGGT